MAMKLLVVFYSLYGHMLRMAEAAAAGAGEVSGTQVGLKRVPETLSHEVLKNMKTVTAQESMAHIPVCSVDEFEYADAIIFGIPTRYGNMCGQMRQFLDASGSMWARDALVGKVGSVMSSSNTQHGGQETTIITSMVTLLHLGMVIVGLPYSFEGQKRDDEITGCSPYGASTIAGRGGRRMPSVNELEGARYQGRHVAEIASRLSRT
jgi:NAD(P)H dehydrogenase (quinone)